MLSFKSTFSLSSFTFIKRLFSSSSLSAIRVVVKIPLDYWTLSVFLCVTFFYPRFWPGYSNWDMCRIHIICPSTNDHHSSLLNVSCLEIIASYLFVHLLFVFVANLKLNLVFCYYILDRRVNLL